MHKKTIEERNLLTFYSERKQHYTNLADIEKTDDGAFRPVEHHHVAQIPAQENRSGYREQVGDDQCQGRCGRQCTTGIDIFDIVNDVCKSAALSSGNADRSEKELDR